MLLPKILERNEAGLLLNIITRFEQTNKMLLDIIKEIWFLNNILISIIKKLEEKSSRILLGIIKEI